MRYFLYFALFYSLSGCDIIGSNTPDAGPDLALNVNWSSIGGPYGGVILSALTTKSNTLVSNVDGGIYWRSLDERNWQTPLGPNLEFQTEIFQDTKGTLFGGRWDTLFVSRDGGKNWSNRTFRSNIYLIAANYVNSVYLLTEIDGIKHTQDGGLSWTSIGVSTLEQDKITDFSISSFEADDEGILYVGTVFNGLFRYDPETALWENIFDPGTNINRIRADSEGVLYILLLARGLMRSFDRGNNWELLSGNWNSILPIYTFDVDQEGNVYLFIESVGLLYSDNLGVSWESIPWPDIFGIRQINALDRNHVLVGTHEGLWLAGINRVEPEHVGVTYSNPGTVFTINENVYWGSNPFPGLGSLFRKELSSEVWSRVVSNGAITSWTVTYDGVYFIGNQNTFEDAGGSILKSIDQGMTWSDLQFPNVSVKALANLPSGEVIVGVGHRIFIPEPLEGGIYLSDDGGTTWDFSELGIVVNALTTLGDNTIFAGGVSDSEGFVFVSTDKGASWKERTLADHKPEIVSLTTDTRGHVFAGTLENGIYRSHDKGKTWHNVSPGLESVTVFSMLAGKDGFIYAGTEAGFYVSSNGVDWNLSGSEMKNQSILGLTIDANDNIYAATETQGVFKGTLNN